MESNSNSLTKNPQPNGEDWLVVHKDEITRIRWDQFLYGFILGATICTIVIIAGCYHYFE